VAGALGDAIADALGDAEAGAVDDALADAVAGALGDAVDVAVAVPEEFSSRFRASNCSDTSEFSFPSSWSCCSTVLVVWASALETAPESAIKAAKDSANNTVSINDLPFIVKVCFISSHLLSVHHRNPFLEAARCGLADAHRRGRVLASR